MPRAAPLSPWRQLGCCVAHTRIRDAGLRRRVTSTKLLENGVLYKIRASGTFSGSNTDDGLADAEYAGFSNPLSSPQDTCSDATQLVNLGIGINDAVIDHDKSPFWGDFNPTHVYTIDFVGQGAPITLNYHDCNFADNAGFLKVEIFQPVVDGTATLVVQRSGL